MHKRQPEFFVIDILIAIDKIIRKTTDITFQEFLQDESAVDVVMRNLEIIGEATSQLLKLPNFLDRKDSKWRKIMDFRNVVVHFYFGIDFDLVFNDIVKNKVPELEQDVLSLIQQKEDKACFLLALEDARADLKEMRRDQSVLYLDNIKNLLKKRRGGGGAT